MRIHKIWPINSSMSYGNHSSRSAKRHNCYTANQRVCSGSNRFIFSTCKNLFRQAAFSGSSLEIVNDPGFVRGHYPWLVWPNHIPMPVSVHVEVGETGGVTIMEDVQACDLISTMLDTPSDNHGQD